VDAPWARNLRPALLLVIPACSFGSFGYWPRIIRCEGLMSPESSTAPISYSIDNSLGVIFEVWSGDITAANLGLYWKTYLANPDVLALRRTVVDLRSANIRFGGNELSALVSDVVIPTLNGRDWKTALVVDRLVQFGVSRQYQAFAESYSTDSIFHDYDEALRWLLEQRS
jgi:hypothetical protein